VIRTLRAQAIADVEGAVEVAQIRCPLQVRHLVHDHVGLGGRDGPAHRFGIEAISNDSRAAEGTDARGLGLGSRRPHHLMTGGQ